MNDHTPKNSRNWYSSSAIPYFINRFAEEDFILNINYLIENEIFLFII